MCRVCQPASKTGAVLCDRNVLRSKTREVLGVHLPVDDLEAAFAGESMAHIKYRYYAKLARAAGALGRPGPLALGGRQRAEAPRRLPGYLVPRLVREIPGELSKTSIS